MGSIKDKYQADLDLEFPTRIFNEVADGDSTAVEWYDAGVTITSVTDIGGFAEFNFTPGPTLVVGQEVRISGFLVETSYNVSGIITVASAGDFQIGIPYTGTEASVGSFEFLVARVTKLVVDECYKTLREEFIGFAADDTRPDVLTTIQTTDNTLTTIATIAIVDETTNIIHVDIIGIQDDGSNRLGSEISSMFYRTGAGSATFIDAGPSGTEDFTVKSAGSWSIPSFAVSGNNVLVQVQGAVATTINWICEADVETFS